MPKTSTKSKSAKKAPTKKKMGASKPPVLASLKKTTKKAPKPAIAAPKKIDPDGFTSEMKDGKWLISFNSEQKIRSENDYYFFCMEKISMSKEAMYLFDEFASLVRDGKIEILEVDGLMNGKGYTNGEKFEINPRNRLDVSIEMDMSDEEIIVEIVRGVKQMILDCFGRIVVANELDYDELYSSEGWLEIGFDITVKDARLGGNHIKRIVYEMEFEADTPIFDIKSCIIKLVRMI